MQDLILGVLVIAGTYLGSAAFAIVLFRVFFPVKTEMAKETLTLAYSKNKSESSSTKTSVYLLSLSDGRDWVKYNS